jgi:bacterioferritin
MSRDRRRERLIDGLNEDLASTLATIIRCTYQAGKVNDPEADRVRRLLNGAITDELRHAAFLTESIIGLGGEPTTCPEEFDKPHSLRYMLELDLLLERGDTRRYEEHARLAGELNDAALQAALEEMAAIEAAHARELEQAIQELWPPAPLPPTDGARPAPVGP